MGSCSCEVWTLVGVFCLQMEHGPTLVLACPSILSEALHLPGVHAVAPGFHVQAIEIRRVFLGHLLALPVCWF